METINYKKPFSRVAFGFVAVIVIQQVLVVLMTVLVQAFAPHIMDTGWYLWAMSYAPLYLVAFPIMLLILRSMPNSPKPTPQGEMTAPNMLLLTVSSLGIVFVLNLLSTAMASLIALFKGSEVTNPLATMFELSSPLVTVLFVSVIAPIMEEIIFRYVIYKKIAPYGDKAYVIFSATLFAFFHMNLYQIFYAFVLGVLLALVYLYTGKLRYPILLHFLINFSGSGVTILLNGYAGKNAVNTWSVLYLAISIVGLVLSFSWLRKQQNQVKLSAGQTPLENIKDIFINVGMIIFLVLTAALMVLNIILI